MTTTRKTYRTTKGNKRYLKKDTTTGRITDNQAHRNVSRADQRRTTVAEAERRVVRAAMAYARAEALWSHHETAKEMARANIELAKTVPALCRACDALTKARRLARNRSK